MALQGFAVKEIGFEPEADDFLGQSRKRRVAEAVGLQGLEVIVQDVGVRNGLFGERRGDGIDVLSGNRADRDRNGERLRLTMSASRCRARSRDGSPRAPRRCRPT